MRDNRGGGRSCDERRGDNKTIPQVRRACDERDPRAVVGTEDAGRLWRDALHILDAVAEDGGSGMHFDNVADAHMAQILEVGNAPVARDRYVPAEDDVARPTGQGGIDMMPDRTVGSFPLRRAVLHDDANPADGGIDTCGGDNDPRWQPWAKPFAGGYRRCGQYAVGSGWDGGFSGLDPATEILSLA